MSTWSGEVKCPQCGWWQIPMNYCPKCGHAFGGVFGAWGSPTPRAADLPNVTVYRLCPNCHQFHPSNVVCPDNSVSR